MIQKTTKILDYITEKTGQILAITPLLLILVQFSVILAVYVFSQGSIKLQESLQYINAVLFLGGAGYAALHGEHVRVDIFYAKLSAKGKAVVDIAGTLFLLFPFLILFWWATIPYVAESWAIFEGSVEASGLPFVYVLKSTLILFGLTLSLNGISDLLKNIQKLKKPKAS